MRLKMMAALLLAVLTAAIPAQAAQMTQAWMVYEDYSGARAEQVISDANQLEELEDILITARSHPSKLKGCTMNCTLFCQTQDGEIYDFACATDGCGYIQNLEDKKVYDLSGDYDRFWAMFSKVQTGMGYTFDDGGLRIAREGQQMVNLLDNTGMYVARSGQPVLQAGIDGVAATDVQVRNYLTVGHSRLETYETGRTACFYIG